ncbi:MAG: nucleotide-binding universal stress UspA family protein [Bacteroidia bacterium]
MFPNSKSSLSVEARLGEPQEVLRRMITEKETDLVVMGTQGATGLKGILVGSVASSVMESLNAPILAIPIEAELHLPKSIAFAADDKSLYI